MSVRVDGAREAAGWLGEIAGRLRAPAPALHLEAERMRDEARAAIQSRTAPDGSSWPEPKTTTARAGERGRPRAPTRRSGRLASSARVARDAPTEVALEFTAPYAGFVQDGTEDMAPRRFLPFDGDRSTGGSLDGLEERVGGWVVGGRS